MNRTNKKDIIKITKISACGEFRDVIRLDDFIGWHEFSGHCLRDKIKTLPDGIFYYAKTWRGEELVADINDVMRLIYD